MFRELPADCSIRASWIRLCYSNIRTVVPVWLLWRRHHRAGSRSARCCGRRTALRPTLHEYPNGSGTRPIREGKSDAEGDEVCGPPLFGPLVRGPALFLLLPVITDLLVAVLQRAVSDAMRPFRIRRIGQRPRRGFSRTSFWLCRRSVAACWAVRFPWPLPVPWAKLAPREHAPLPVKGGELWCSTRRFVGNDVDSVGPAPTSS